jgi:hypothetical protein
MLINIVKLTTTVIRERSYTQMAISSKTWLSLAPYDLGLDFKLKRRRSNDDQHSMLSIHFGISTDRNTVDH